MMNSNKNFESLLEKSSNEEDSTVLESLFQDLRSDSSSESLPNEQSHDLMSWSSSFCSKCLIDIVQQRKKGIAHQIWPAATLLCNFILQNPRFVLDSIVSSKRNIKETRGEYVVEIDSNPSEEISFDVLEIGAGLGLTGLYLAQHFKSSSAASDQSGDSTFACSRKSDSISKKLVVDRVILTDLKEALEGIFYNINLNNLSNRVFSCELSWGMDEQIDSIWQRFGYSQGNVPIVIAADVVYWECLYEPLARCLKRLASLGCHIYIAHIKRWKKDGAFFKSLSKKGMNMTVDVISETVVFSPHEHTGEPTKQIQRIYNIKPSNGLSS